MTIEMIGRVTRVEEIELPRDSSGQTNRMVEVDISHESSREQPFELSMNDVSTPELLERWRVGRRIKVAVTVLE